ncbi:uncharacterized protein K02A2.6-like [Morus notabilis]|uniref:uncharacterized protein K02A2.6-like n=1 Tax=Morus notabilis TaxID=981085 RepID=UPI000CED6CD4|nr:uncharacterized protein K02A2.6-like [Morus notabilis]
MRVQDKQVTFNMFKAMRFPSEMEECSAISVIDSLVAETLEHDNFESNVEGGVEQVELVGAHVTMPSYTRKFESLDLIEREHQPTQPLSKEPPILKLKPLPAHLRYAYLGDSSTLPVIISALLTQDQEGRLIEVLRESQGAIGWTIADIKGISPSFCMHKILLEDDKKGSIEGQRRMNPIMKEVVKKEVIKWLDAGIIYPISDSAWVSPVQCVPKKGGMTVVENEKNELIPTRTVTGWQICMDYKRLNKATRKDHFPLPFIDQMLDRLASKEFYYLLDGYSGYNQIVIAPEDQHKTTFTCPFGTFVFRRMPFGLCNAPTTF